MNSVIELNVLNRVTLSHVNIYAIWQFNNNFFKVLAFFCYLNLLFDIYDLKVNYVFINILLLEDTQKGILILTCICEKHYNENAFIEMWHLL